MNDSPTKMLHNNMITKSDTKSGSSVVSALASGARGYGFDLEKNIVV